MRVIRILLLGIIALVLGVQTGGAATISFADAMTILARDCGADVKKFCKNENLGNDRIRSCLVENQAKISPVCAQSLVAVIASVEQRLKAQASVVNVCRGDASRWCQGVVAGDAHLLDCLLKTKRVVTAKCNAAITNAGWR